MLLLFVALAPAAVEAAVAATGEGSLSDCDGGDSSVDVVVNDSQVVVGVTKR